MGQSLEVSIEPSKICKNPPKKSHLTLVNPYLSRACRAFREPSEIITKHHGGNDV